jgi:hypothetical protein
MPNEKSTSRFSSSTCFCALVSTLHAMASVSPPLGRRTFSGTKRQEIHLHTHWPHRYGDLGD